MDTYLPITTHPLLKMLEPHGFTINGDTATRGTTVVSEPGFIFTLDEGLKRLNRVTLDGTIITADDPDQLLRRILAGASK